MRNRNVKTTGGHGMNPFSGTPTLRASWRRRHRAGAVFAAIVLALMCLGLGAGLASAQIQLTSFTAGPVGGQNATQAGAHVDVQTTFMTASDPNTTMFGQPIQAETTKDVTVDLPAGFAGSTTVAPKCTLAHLTNSTCPVSSQIGTAEIIANGNFLTDGQTNSATYGVYLLQPSEGHTAEFGFTVAGIGNVLAVATVRSGTDYGLHVELKSLPTEFLPFMFGARLTLWGVPADPVHNALRVAPGAGFVDPSTPVASTAPAVPFLTNPTHCDGSPVVTSITLDSYQSPDQPTSSTAQAPPVTGCDRLQFNPTLDLQPDSGRAGQPAGYQVDLKVPQNEAPNALGTANVKDVTVTLPQGVSVSPSSADGLQGCLIQHHAPRARSSGPSRSTRRFSPTRCRDRSTWAGRSPTTRRRDKCCGSS
jgi:hypothetical protein